MATSGRKRCASVTPRCPSAASPTTGAALAAGASGHLLKAMRPDELQSAVRAVASGQGFLAPAVASVVIQDAVTARGRDERDASLLEPLALAAPGGGP